MEREGEGEARSASPMTQLVLSIVPGIGMLDHAFSLEGFTVVRGPDVIWGGDIRTFHPPPGRFDGIIGGDPCGFSHPLMAHTFAVLARSEYWIGVPRGISGPPVLWVARVAEWGIEFHHELFDFW